MKAKAGKEGQSGTSGNDAGKGDGKEHDHHVHGQVHHHVGDKEGKKPIQPRHPQNGHLILFVIILNKILFPNIG
jgi:hypothetical protein